MILGVYPSIINRDIANIATLILILSIMRLQVGTIIELMI